MQYYIQINYVECDDFGHETIIASDISCMVNRQEHTYIINKLTKCFNKLCAKIIKRRK